MVDVAPIKEKGMGGGRRPLHVVIYVSPMHEEEAAAMAAVLGDELKVG